MSNNITNLVKESLISLKPQDNDPENVKNLKFENRGIILFLILNNLFKDSKEIKNIVFEKFEIFEDIYADIVSSESNPNCSCRNRVIKYFSKNFDKIINLIFELLDLKDIKNNTYANIEKSINSQIDYYNQELSPQKLKESTLNYLAGQIWEIEDSPIAYGEVIDTLRQSMAVYKGISIIKIDSKLKLYFY
jgi:hypothetical protein